MKKEEVFEQVIGAMKETVGEEIDIKMDTEFKSIGLDSMTFIKVVVAIEDEFDFEFWDDCLDYKKFGTVAEFCECVVKMLEEE